MRYVQCLLALLIAVAALIGQLAGEQPQQKKQRSVKFSAFKKGEVRPKLAKLKARTDPGDFVLQEGMNDDVTVEGIDATGNVVDLSDVAKLTVTSSDPSVVQIGPATPPSPMAYNEKALKPGSATITVVATWTDGSQGPFTVTYTCTAAPNPNPAVTGLVLTHGTPKLN